MFYIARNKPELFYPDIQSAIIYKTPQAARVSAKSMGCKVYRVTYAGASLLTEEEFVFEEVK
jgi:hypothetical protein